MAIWISVPMIACRIPPTLSGSSGPASRMSWVKKFRCGSALRPDHSV